MNEYLDPDVIAKAQALGVQARTIVEGLRVGDHKSPYRGFSVEFVQHREYVPGDDIRHIDWKGYGRSERYTIKQYEQETNFTAHLMLDAGASAVIGSHPHVTQGAEVYRGKPIIYSLGNFVFDGFHDPETTTGWLLRLKVTGRGVVRWDTVIARLDAQGTPHPEFAAQSPCGDAAGVRACAGGADFH